MIGSKFLIPEEVRETFSLFEAHTKKKSRDWSKERQVSSKELYLHTKNLLESQAWDGNQKREILDLYIQAWKNFACFLNISNTDYAKGYTYERLGQCQKPMLAGFDLSSLNANGLSLTDLTFIDVNFQNADFSKVCFAYGRFEDCELRGVQTSHETDLDQCYFIGCNCAGTNLSVVGLSEASFKQCNIFNTKLSDSRAARGSCLLDVNDCIGYKNNPDRALSLFTTYKLNPAKVTAERLAHRVWLNDESEYDTRHLMPQLKLWLKHKERGFGIEEVEEVIKNRYAMKA